MRWDDERYVRFYTRNTPEWLALSWQARGLMGLLLREVDRAGILRVGRLGLRGVAVQIQAPWPEVEPRLKELLEDGCVKFVPTKAIILIPNFQVAQDVSMSDKLRKQLSREKARFEADPETVTKRDEESQVVQTGHDSSQQVTPAVPSEPSSAEPSLAEQNRSVPSRGSRSRAHRHGGVNGSSTSHRGCSVTATWRPSKESLTYCAEKGIDPESVIEDFINYWGASGKVLLDWNQKFIKSVDRLIEQGRAPRTKRKKDGTTSAYGRIIHKGKVLGGD